MQKKLILILLAGLFSQLSFADTCPSVKDIQQKKIAGWKAYDSDEGTLLSAKRTKTFLHSAEQFVLAEWATDSQKNGAIHCYYRDKNGSDLEAYLAKGHFVPDNSKVWYQVSGALQCAAKNEMCQFKNIIQQAQLAKN